MKKTIRFLAVPALLGLAVACAAGSSSSHGATAPGGPASSSDDHGARLYRTRCASCHRLHDPHERSADDWRRVLERMAPRGHLGPSEHAAVLAYLSANAKGAPGP